MTLQEAFMHGFDNQNRRDLSTDFARQLPGYRDMIVKEYEKNNKVSLSDEIAKLAKKESLTDDQIKRLIEEVNNQVYLILYNKKKNSPEREVIFELASFPSVKGERKTRIKDKEEKNEKTAMEKIASFFDEVPSIFGQKSNSFSLGCEKDHSYQKQIFSELKKITESMDNQLIVLASEASNQMNFLAESLASYDLHYKDVNANKLYHELCKHAQFEPELQIMLRSITKDHINNLIEDNKIPKNTKCSLTLEDPFQKTAFTLNDFSLNDQTTYCPPITIKGTPVANFDFLLKIAASVCENQTEIKKINHKKDKLKEVVEKLGMSFDVACKIGVSPDLLNNKTDGKTILDIIEEYT